MKKKNLSYIIIIFLLGISCVVSWSVHFKTYSQVDTVNIHKFPKIIGDWKSKDLIITESEYEILETRNVFVREYKNAEGQKIQLFIVYSQNNRKVSHPPEVCYKGGGISILSNNRVFVNKPDDGFLIEGNKLLLEQGTTRQVAYYWFKVGGTFTSSYWKQQILIVLKTLFAKPSSSALIRVSTVIEGEKSKIAEDLLKEFSSQIIPLIRTHLP